MAQTVIVKLTDDLEGGDAEETVVFALDGRTYEIDLNSKNAAALRKDLDKYVSKARHSSRASAPRPRQARSDGKSDRSPTLFSQLDVEEKDRFRAWASMPNARRIADSRVREWMESGKP